MAIFAPVFLGSNTAEQETPPLCGKFTLLDNKKRSVGHVLRYIDGNGRLIEEQHGAGRVFQVTRHFANTDIISSTTEKNKITGNNHGLRTRRYRDGSLNINECAYFNRGFVHNPVSQLWPSSRLRGALHVVRLFDEVRFGICGRDHKTKTERANAQVERATFFRRQVRHMLGRDVFEMTTRNLPVASI